MFDCMVHCWLLLYVVYVLCVYVCVYPLLLSQSLKSSEDQTDNMKYSGMEETGNHQVLLHQIKLWFMVLRWEGAWDCLGADQVGSVAPSTKNLQQPQLFNGIFPVFKWLFDPTFEWGPEYYFRGSKLLWVLSFDI